MKDQTLYQAICYFFGFAGEKEREFIAERTMRNKMAWAHKGRMPVGTGLGLYGYRYNKQERKREKIEEEAQVVRKCFDMVISGYSVWEIAKILNEAGIPTKGNSKWHPLTVKRLLTNPAYMGISYYGRERVKKIKGGKRERSFRKVEEWIEVPGFTPPIITKEVFELAQKRLQEPKLRTGRPLTPYLLRGHAFCGYCNSLLIGSYINHPIAIIGAEALGLLQVNLRIAELLIFQLLL